MSRIILQKRDGALVATDDESVAALARIKAGTEVVADVRRARNVHQHRLFFSLCNIAAEAVDLPVDTIRKDALINLGYTETWMGVDGKIHIEAKSIAFDKMPQDEFDPFMSRAVELLSGWIGSERRDLLDRFNQLAADKRFEGMRRG